MPDVLPEQGQDLRELLLAGYFVPPVPGHNGGPRVASVWLGLPEELDAQYERAVRHVEKCGFECLVFDSLKDWNNDEKLRAKVQEIRQQVIQAWCLSHPDQVSEELPPGEDTGFWGEDIQGESDEPAFN